jgi:hypothetical protein
VPGIRRSVTVSAPPSPDVVDPTSEQTVWVSQQVIIYLFCNLKSLFDFCFAIYKFTIYLFCKVLMTFFEL